MPSQMRYEQDPLYAVARGASEPHAFKTKILAFRTGQTNRNAQAWLASQASKHPKGLEEVGWSSSIKFSIKAHSAYTL